MKAAIVTYLLPIDTTFEQTLILLIFWYFCKRYMIWITQINWWKQKGFHSKFLEFLYLLLIVYSCWIFFLYVLIPVGLPQGYWMKFMTGFSNTSANYLVLSNWWSWQPCLSRFASTIMWRSGVVFPLSLNCMANSVELTYLKWSLPISTTWGLNSNRTTLYLRRALKHTFSQVCMCTCCMHVSFCLPVRTDLTALSSSLLSVMGRCVECPS